MDSLQIVLLSSAFNGLTQRAWLELQEAGHQVSFQLFTHEEEVIQNISQSDADLVICPFLKNYVPEILWANPQRPVIIIHPGIVGDRGASSLDWAILNQEAIWGVTALQAVAEMDAGPVWASHTFRMPKSIRKSQLYNTLVTDAALKCIHQVVDNYQKGIQPVPVDYTNPSTLGRLRPYMKQSDRQFNWSDKTEAILRKINAADGLPGVLSQLAGEALYLYDAHPDQRQGVAGEILAVQDDAVLVATGDASIWIGSLKRKAAADEVSFKLPATQVLNEAIQEVPRLSWPQESSTNRAEAYQPISYQRVGDIGEIRFEFYNGAMSTQHCQRLIETLRWAKNQNTSVLLIKSGRGSFSNGVHLNVIEAASDPAAEAWANIQAIDDVCQEILTAQQLTIVGIAGNAGAGGVMLALAADIVLARADIVLNPHYKTMGLYGSELWTYTLPRAVGEQQAKRLTDDCYPISTRHALALGLIQQIGPRDWDEFNHWLMAAAQEAFHHPAYQHIRERKAELRLPAVLACRAYELKEMRQDMLQNRHQFAEKRRNFVLKQCVKHTPQHLLASRSKSWH